jgi:hypothetical protein
MLSTLSILGLTKSAAVIATAVPIFVMGLPLFDTAFAIFRRLINGKPIMQADKGHMHHRLMQLGYGQRRATLMLYGVSAIMGIAAVMFSRDLEVEGFGLMAVAAMDIYIFLTDSSHAVPKIIEEKEGVDGEKKARKYNLLEMLIPGSFTGEIYAEDSVVGHVGNPEKYIEHARAFTEKHALINEEEGILIPNDNDRKPMNKF